MKATGVVRKIDPLGRLVIPIEVRRMLGLRENEPVEMFIDGTKVVIQKYVPACIICGSLADVHTIDDKNICDICVEKIKKM